MASFGLSPSELAVLRRLNTPIKIQDYLDRMPLNWEKRGETYMSPRRSLRAHKMHCFEGALFAALALWLQGEAPLLFDLKTEDDVDHVVTLYKSHGYWGAISKTNHASLRFRDPLYKNLRELALSYFHEYFDNTTGKKLLYSYSAEPFDLRRYDTDWITTEHDLISLAHDVDTAPHRRLVPTSNRRYLRRADRMERRAGRLIEWLKSDPRT